MLTGRTKFKERIPAAAALLINLEKEESSRTSEKKSAIETGGQPVLFVF
jgi:hypothetical protein